MSRQKWIPIPAKDNQVSVVAVSSAKQDEEAQASTQEEELGQRDGKQVMENWNESHQDMGGVPEKIHDRINSAGSSMPFVPP